MQKIIATLVLLPTVTGWLNASPMGTAFNYQGYLTVNGNAANGQFDIRFELYDAATGLNNKVGPTITRAPVDVSKGLFSTNIDFGAVFDGKAYWLEIAIRPNGSVSSYTVQSPRLQIRPVPDALFAATADLANTANAVAANTVGGAAIQNNSITAAKVASGQVVKSLNGLTDNITLAAGTGLTLTPNGNTLTMSASGGGASGWSLTGNAGTTGGANFLGTTDDQPLELHVNGNRGLRLQWASDGGFLASYGVNVLAGYWGNVIDSGVLGGTISGGGGGWSFGNSANSLSANYAAIGGGDANQIGSGAVYGTIPGGYGNLLASGAAYSFAAGKLAYAQHPGCFVWADSTTSVGLFGSDTFSSERPNEFAIRAAGGVRMQTSFLQVAGLGNEKAYLGGDGSGGDVQLGSLNPQVSAVACYNAGNGSYMDLYLRNLSATDAGYFGGDVSVRTLTIRGGADLAEPFQMSHTEVPKGSVVVIDEEHPGQLKLSTESYDTRVAGIVSGAGGIDPGVSLHQEGKLENGQNVALTGRVYVLADAANGSIKPGDLLTTSSTLGHAMKVTDHARAQGAVLGKAMSTLAQGKGMVLVLVTLQ